MIGTMRHDQEPKLPIATPSFSMPYNYYKTNQSLGVVVGKRHSVVRIYPHGFLKYDECKEIHMKINR